MRRNLSVGPFALDTKLLARRRNVGSRAGRRATHRGIYRWSDRVLTVVSKNSISRRIATDDIVGLAIVHSDEQRCGQVFRSVEDRDSPGTFTRGQRLVDASALVSGTAAGSSRIRPLDSLVSAIYHSHYADCNNFHCHHPHASGYRR